MNKPNLSIKQWLQQTTKMLSAVSNTDALDAQLLLCHQLKKPRSFLFSHPEEIIDDFTIEPLNQLVKKRLSGEPMAYILGQKSFWQHDFSVNQHVLIPRPETEQLVALALEYINNDLKLIADLGTGSGAIAISLALARPNWEIEATDISQQAIDVAKQNAQQLGANNIQWHIGSWLEPLKHPLYHAIISNPPYIAENDPELDPASLAHEPQQALISGTTGLDDLTHIIQQSLSHLKPGGLLLLEHGAKQAPDVQALMKAAGFTSIITHNDLANLPRITMGKHP